MRPIAIAMLVVGTCCDSLLAADPPLSQEAKRFLAAQDSLAERKIGVLLQASASLGKYNSEAAIHIKWMIDYDGLRQPLIILRPELNSTTAGQSVLRCFAVTKTGEVQHFDIKAPKLGGLPGPGKDWMITVKRGEKAIGTVTLPLASLRQELKRHCSLDFADVGAFFVQLCHKPTDRMLDGWTGELYTKVLQIPVGN